VFFIYFLKNTKFENKKEAALPGQPPQSAPNF
jgi:hypothetical protein